jgi:UDP-N-acetylmuramate--alanine ligase
MDIKFVNNIYFIGIGGIGMSAIARYFNLIGKKVAGYDRTASDLTRELEKEGIPIKYDYNPELIPASFRIAKDTIVVYTPAVPENIPLVQWFRQNNFTILKRAQVLGLLTISRKGICVAGTHGKTTVSTMIGHILNHSWVGCSAFLGGISQNYNTNLLVSAESNYVVIEADEYDRSFHQLTPSIAVITSIDADHLDVYGSFNSLKESFEKFTSLVVRNGILIVKKGVELNINTDPSVRLYSYSAECEADFYVQKVRIEQGCFVFDFVTPDKTIKNLMLGVPGRVNLENAVAALAVSYLVGASDVELNNGIMSFRGIKRRFEYHLNKNGYVYIDDYAHHPKEIEATLKSVRELYPNRFITGVFQPHLFSRTRDLAEEFAESLDLLDELLLCEIYPAREDPMPEITAKLIFDKIKHAKKSMITKEQLFVEISKRKPDFLITMGAGDIGDKTEQIKQIMESFV